jgi:hypothetical protein
MDYEGKLEKGGKILEWRKMKKNTFRKNIKLREIKERDIVA